jgi:hypothetical protein
VGADFDLRGWQLERREAGVTGIAGGDRGPTEQLWNYHSVPGWEVYVPLFVHSLKGRWSKLSSGSATAVGRSVKTGVQWCE